MIKEMDENLIQTGDLVLFSRIQQLVKLGQLESRGNMADMRQSEVRLPTKT